MATKDPKKIEHTEERHELAKKIKNIRNSEKDSETKKKEISDLLLGKQVTEMKQESKEKVEKIPELEYINYKIDENMTIEEKLQNGRKKEENVLIDIFYDGIHKTQTRIETTVLEKNLGNNAYVWEYFENTDMHNGNYLPREYIGEQKFNREAVKKLGLVDKLPKNYQEFEKIVGPYKAKRLVSTAVVGNSRLEEYCTPDYKNFLQKYFSKNGKLVFSGFRKRKFPNQPLFSLLAVKEFLFLGDGTLVVIGENSMHSSNSNEVSHRGGGYSLRFLKK